jgi:hypothetical protein
MIPIIQPDISWGYGWRSRDIFLGFVGINEASFFMGDSMKIQWDFMEIYMGYLRNDGRNYTTFMGNYNIGIIMGQSWD